MKRNGTYEWIFQRCSMVFIAAYTIFYVSLILSMETPDYATWRALHEPMWFKVLSSFVLLWVMANAVLAGWQIGTDYTQKVPVPGFGPLFHGFYALGSICFLSFGLYILWFL